MTKEWVAKNWIASYIARFVQEAGGCKERREGSISLPSAGA